MAPWPCSTRFCTRGFSPTQRVAHSTVPGEPANSCIQARRDDLVGFVRQFSFCRANHGPESLSQGVGKVPSVSRSMPVALMPRV